MIEAVTTYLPAPPARVVMIGNFDGVHRGHQQLIRQTLELAEALQARPCALTFSPHPRRFFQGDAAPPMLTDDEGRARLLKSHGIQETLVLPFDAQLAGLSADEFSWDILKSRLGAVHVVVGAGYRFGRSREGGTEDLHRLGDLHGYGVTVTELALGCDSQPFSSTRVRNALARGDLQAAGYVLGRPWSHRALIVGEQVRARLTSGAAVQIPAGEYWVAVKGAGRDVITETVLARIGHDGQIVLDWPLAFGRRVSVDLDWLAPALCANQSLQTAFGSGANDGPNRDGLCARRDSRRGHQPNYGHSNEA